MPFRQETDDIQYLGRLIFVNLPDNNITQSKGSTTPSVTNLDLLVFTNTAPITITNFLGGTDGQLLRVKGDGQTTIQNNASLLTSTGANKLLGIHIYMFTYTGNQWVENG